MDKRLPNFLTKAVYHKFINFNFPMTAGNGS